RLGVLVPQSFDYRCDRRMQPGEQLLFDSLFGHRRQRHGFAWRPSLAGIEVEGKDALSLHRYTRQLGGFESPLLRRLKRGVAQQWMPTDDLRVDHLSTLANRDLNLNRAAHLRGSGRRRVSRLNFPGCAAIQDAAGDFDLSRVSRR